MLWLSKPSVLNDPFESFVNTDFNPNKLINFAEDYQFFSDDCLTELWHERVEKGENIIEVLKQMTDEIENEDEKILAKDKLYYCYKNMCEFYMQSSLGFTKLIAFGYTSELSVKPLDYICRIYDSPYLCRICKKCAENIPVFFQTFYAGRIYCAQVSLDLIRFLDTSSSLIARHTVFVIIRYSFTFFVSELSV